MEKDNNQKELGNNVSNRTYTLGHSSNYLINSIMNHFGNDYREDLEEVELIKAFMERLDSEVAEQFQKRSPEIVDKIETENLKSDLYEYEYLHTVKSIIYYFVRGNFVIAQDKLRESMNNLERAYDTCSDNGTHNYGTDKSYLTTACMRHYKDDYRPDCYELMTIKLFLQYLSAQDLEHFNKLSPRIVEGINEQNSEEYEQIYNCIVKSIVEAIDTAKYKHAKDLFNASLNELSKKYVRTNVEQCN